MTSTFRSNRFKDWEDRVRAAIDTGSDSDPDPDPDPDPELELDSDPAGPGFKKVRGLRGGTDEEESRQVDVELPLILADRKATRPGFEGDPPHDIFKLANGRVILCKGKVSTCFAFPFEEKPALPIEFHILEPLAASVIIGRAFLDATETLTTHLNRLIRTPRPFGMQFSPPRILHLSSPRRALQCYINSTAVRANADTGAEMNLASSEFVARAGLRPQLPDHRHQYVQLADGSIVPISGCFRARFNPSEKPSPETMRPRAHMKTFYVLDGLTTDVLLGRDLLFEIYAFVEQANAFIEIKCPDLYADLNLIAWLEGWRSGSSSHSVSRTSLRDADSTFWRDIDADDAREQRRQQRAKADIRQLTTEAERAAGEIAESEQRLQYDRRRQQRVEEHEARMTTLRVGRVIREGHPSG